MNRVNLTFDNLKPAEMKQQEYDFSTVTNFKEFFITCDGISRAGYDTFISVFRRYKCEAGCDVCYIRDRWIDKDGREYFSKYIPDAITDEMETRILNAFDHFQTVATIDDLFFVKNKHPDLFEFYKRNSKRVNLTSMTDMALIQQTHIALHDLDFNSIYDVTISDTFVQNPAIFTAVVRNLEALTEKYTLVKLRFIISTDPTVDRTNVAKLVAWAKNRGIYTTGSNDNQGGNWFFVNKILDMVDHKETAYTVSGQELHQIYTEVTHLMLDRWVVSFYQSTQDEDLSFYKLDSKFKPDAWLESLLREKLRQYDHSRTVMVRDANNANYFDYFTYIADNVTIHSNWNFIPRVMFDQRSSNYYHKLAENGFVETPLGLLRATVTNNDTIVPIYSFSK